MTDEEAARAARELANELTADIQLSRTREDHIVRTRRATAAAALAAGLEDLESAQFDEAS